jgi:hypothetical protein
MTRDDDQLSFDVDDVQRVITVIMRGLVTDRRLYEVLVELRSMPQYESAYSVVFDARDVSVGQVTGDGEYDLARLTHTDVNRMAIVVPDAVSFGMAQIYEICANWKDHRVSVFTNMPEALEWLGSTA